MKNLKPEMIEKAKAAKSVEELLDLAKANNIDMTADEAATCFAQLNPKSGELSDWVSMGSGPKAHFLNSPLFRLILAFQ